MSIHSWEILDPFDTAILGRESNESKWNPLWKGAFFYHYVCQVSTHCKDEPSIGRETLRVELIHESKN